MHVGGPCPRPLWALTTLNLNMCVRLRMLPRSLERNGSPPAMTAQKAHLAALYASSMYALLRNPTLRGEYT